MVDRQAEEIAQLMTATRRETLALFDLAREEDLRRSPGGGFRPIIWHLAHIGVFEAYWLLQQVGGESAPDERYERIFDPIKTPREESKDLPSRREMENYLALVRGKTLRCLEAVRFDRDDPLLANGYVFDLVLEHEWQHQETLAYLIHLLDPARKTRPFQTPPCHSSAPLGSPPLPVAGEMVSVPAGSFQMGSVWPAFAYDNELPPQEIFVPAFGLDRLLTTNGEYAHFISEGGYERREWWSTEGWEWRTRENWTHPLYWSLAEGDAAAAKSSPRPQQWRARRMFDEGMIDPLHPVVGVSWYEAEAYARFMNKRLPTEAEWEKAASWDARRGHKSRYAWGDELPDAGAATAERGNYGSRFWGTTPIDGYPAGASPAGCLDMTGNVWEWTSDAFAGYPGFKPFPYPEYSETWFDGDHRVLKGGSWATRASVLRTSFRNFFRRHFRIAFAGIRCAADG